MLNSESMEELVFLNETEINCANRNAAFTPIRRAVLILLYRHPSGLGAYDLLDRIRAIKPKASPPTVYRALAFLTKQGFARKINCVNVFVCCDRKMLGSSQPGVFLVCPQCKSVTELKDKTIMSTISSRLAEAGHIFDQQKFEISALCPACIT